jgi:hypothetical protein
MREKEIFYSFVVEFTVSLVALPCLYSLQLMELKGLTEVINVLTCIREAPESNAYNWLC